MPSATKVVTTTPSTPLPAPAVGQVVLQVSPVRQIVVADNAVVEAYGNVEARVVDVAEKYEPTISPTTDNFAYGEVVPIPTFPPPLKIASKLFVPPVTDEIYSPTFDDPDPDHEPVEVIFSPVLIVLAKDDVAWFVIATAL